MKPGCGKYEDRLLDLVYDELDDAAAEAIRSHAAECTACAAAVSELLAVRRLSSRPFALTPSEALDDAVLTAARDSLSEAAVATGVRDVAPVHRTESPRFWDTLRAWLLHPAFAGAAVIALVLTMTLFFSLRSPKSEAPTDVESLLAEQAARSEEPPAAAAAPPGTQRAEERDEKAAPSPTAGVSASSQSEIAPEPARADDTPEPPFSAADRKASASSKSAPKKEAKGRAASPSGLDGDARPKPRASSGRSASSTAGAGAESARAKTPAVDPVVGEVDDILSPPVEEDLSSRRKRKSDSIEYAPPPPARAPAGRRASVAADAEEMEAQAPLAPQAGAGEKSARTTAPTAQPQTDAYTEGMAAFRRGDCTEAVARLSEVVASPTLFSGRIPAALHHLGRCEARRGRCATALRWYDELIARHPKYAALPEALYEAARCAERLGRKEKARALLTKLRQYRGWESRAAEMEERVRGE